MYPILSNLLLDNETLFGYERGETFSNSNAVQNILRRLQQYERMTNPAIPDYLYEGLKESTTDGIRTIVDLVTEIPIRLSNHFCEMRHCKVYIKPALFNDWIDHISVMPPLLVVICQFLDQFQLEYIGTNQLHTFIERWLIPNIRYTALVPPHIMEVETFVKKVTGLYDLHIHLNGTTETDVFWPYFLKNSDKVIADFASSYRNDPNVRNQAEQIISDFNVKTLRERSIQAKSLKTSLIKWAVNPADTPFRQPTPQEEFEYKPIHKFWGEESKNSVYGDLICDGIFLLCVLKKLKKTHEQLAAQSFHHYLLIEGIIHRFLVQQRSQVGFSQFQQITNNNFRTLIEQEYAQRFGQLAGNHPKDSCIHFIEGRFSPKDTPAQNISLIARIEKGLEKAKLKDKVELRLIAHFIKKPENAAKENLPVRHRSLRLELKKKACALIGTIHAKTHYSRYITGIDAAASELDAGPEVFAPAFHFLRKEGIENVTFHAGEDFRHLISGLRSIGEALEFLDLQTGNRIGHATACGIHPKLWLKRMKNNIYMPQGEWLDDLVFIWYIAGKNEKLCTLKPNIESLIDEYSFKIYNRSYSPIQLWEAWKLRKYDPFVYLYHQSAESFWKDEGEEDIYLRFENHQHLLFAYHSSLSNPFFGRCRRAYDKIQKVDASLFNDAEILAAFQIEIIKIIKQKGVVIESLLSSNTRISLYKHINEHHLERWLVDKSQEGAAIPLVIGSDDPGIFMTNIYNEYCRIYLYLRDKNYSVTQCMEYIADLHRMGEVYSFKEL